MQYVITYSNGVEVPVNAASIDDDGMTLKLRDDGGNIIYRVADCEIVCCELVGENITDRHAITETMRGVLLTNSDGLAVAVYRNCKPKETHK